MVEIALLAVAVLVIMLTLGVPLPWCFGAGLAVMYFAGDVVMKGNMLWGFQQLGNPVLLAIPLLAKPRRQATEVSLAVFLLTQGGTSFYFVLLYNEFLRGPTLETLAPWENIPLVLIYACQGPALLWYTYAAAGQRMVWHKGDLIVAGIMTLVMTLQVVMHLTGGIQDWKERGYATEVQVDPAARPAEQQPESLCPKPGEVLVDLSGPSVSLLGPPWLGPGSPSVISLGFPANPLLVGQRVYAQGVVLDPIAAQGVAIGLTEAAEITLGS